MIDRYDVLPSLSRHLGLICGLLLSAVGQMCAAAEPSAPQIKQARVNDVTLVYEEQGDGAPVVLVHGCCTDYRAWDAQRPTIAQHYRFIGLTLRYHGTAPWPDDGSQYSQQAHADDIAAFIQGLNAGPVDLIGWSYSGPIVMMVTLRHPELVHSLAIHEPGSTSFVTDAASLKTAGEDRQAMLGQVIAAAKAGDVTEASRLVPIAVNHQPNFWDTATADTRSMFADNARTIPLFVKAPPPPPVTCDQLHLIKAPVLITYGADTRPFYRIAAEGAAGCIPGAQLVAIEGGRHLAIIQRPEPFNETLLSFLAKARAQPKP